MNLIVGKSINKIVHLMLRLTQPIRFCGLSFITLHANIVPHKSCFTDV